jgi:kynurenine formamidase/predicted nucleotidyltransferase
MLDMEKKYKKAIDSVLLQYPYTYYVYGSRVKGKAKDYSDLDLCIFDRISIDKLGEIKEKLNNILLPFSIDVVIWHRLSDEFKSIIEKDLIRYTPDPFLGANIIELSYQIDKSTPTWPGSKFELHFLNKENDLFNLQEYTFSGGLGTHIDSPAHIIKGGNDVTSFGLKSFIAPCSIVYMSQAIDAHFVLTARMLQEFEKNHGAIAPQSWVLIMTGWGKRWQDPVSYKNFNEQGMMQFPTLSEDAAQFLISRNVLGLGIDTLSPDKDGSTFQVHKLLLGANILILENIRYLETLSYFNGFLVVMPLAIKGGFESPARVLLVQQAA